jgi:hypothetical protein
MWTYNYSHRLELYHYGVLGMKWGVRRTKEQLGYRRSSKAKATVASSQRIARGQNEPNEIPALELDVSDFISDIWKLSDLPLIKEKHTTETDLAAVNPNYAKGLPYQLNCGNCVTAFELRKRGFDVEALPGAGMFEEEFQERFRGIKLIAVEDKKQIPQIRQKVANWGEGARGFVITVSGDETGAEESMSHVFSVEVVDGKAKFVDPQNPKRNVEDRFDIASRAWFSRVDNLEIADGVLDSVKTRDRG